MLFLPLDDRPANLLFVLVLLALGGADPCLWTRFDGVEAKHREGPPPIRTLADMSPPPAGPGPDLINLNTLAARSLVGSRTADPRKLPVPKLPQDGLYWFVVPRIEPTARDPATQAAYADIRNLLSPQQTGRQQRVLAVLKGDAGWESLENPHLRDWAQRTDGWFRWIEKLRLPPDRLLILFDDNRQGPLSSYLRERYGWLSDHVIDGADEGGCLAAARAVKDRQKQPLQAAVVYTNPGSAGQRGRYEGMGVSAILAHQAAWTGLTLVERSRLHPGEPILLVHNWTTTQGDRHTVHAANPNPFPPPWNELAERLAGHPVYVADIAFANGGDPAAAAELMRLKQAGQLDLRGYAGWNTAANSLGTALATLVVDQSRKPSPQGDALRDQFLTARLLDDVVYQSFLRQRMEEELRKAKGDPWALTRFQTVQAEDKLTKELRQEAFARGWIPSPSEWSLALPWQRYFEATVTTSKLRRLVTGTPRCE